MPDKNIYPSSKTKSIKSSNKKINSKKIEASGVLWQQNNRHYLVISDESTKKQSTILIMNADNLLVSDQLTMLNYDFDDLESLSSDGMYTYALCSLSSNQANKLKNKRKQFVRFKYQKNRVTNQQNVNLYKILKTEIKQQPNSQHAEFLFHAIKQHAMDIESHFVKDDQLYIGFKSPFINSEQTLILKLDSLSSIFENKSAHIDCWKTLALIDPETDKAMRLTDMLMVKQKLYLLSVSKGSKDHSILWCYQKNKDQLKIIKQFSGLKAEGLAYTQQSGQFIIVFDRGGNKSSKYIRFKYLAHK